VKWRWIDKRALVLLHDESLADHGGAVGLRDEALLDSALARPRHLGAYGNPDFADLAAAYGAGIVENHPFVDGNKRVGFLALGLFLSLNGYELHAPQADAALAVIALAEGKLDEQMFARWIRGNARKRPTRRGGHALL